MTLQALIFDVDGTLADTEKDGHRVAFNLAFEQAGLSDWYWDENLYEKLLDVTGGKERIRYYLSDFNHHFVKPDNFSDFVANLHASKTAFYMQLMETGKIPLRTGVKRLFAQARASSLKLAIATTTTPANVTALLTHTLGAESIDWFEVIAAGDVVPAKKPAADIYQYALDKMGLTADQCLAFEDSENGLKSALGAGLKTVITINDYTRHHDFSGAAIVLDQFGDEQHPFTILASAVPGLESFQYFDLQLAEKLSG